MNYLEKAEETIRKNWFGESKIKSIKGEDGFQEIIFGRPGSSMYQINYTLTGNMVYISGDLGVAAYALTGPATIKEISRYDLSYFTGKLVASQRDKYEFNTGTAQKQITEYFLDWTDTKNIKEFPPEIKHLFHRIIDATVEWGTTQQFNSAIFNIYQQCQSDFFDSEAASIISGCGQRLSYSIISYWLGLQMIAELQEVK